MVHSDSPDATARTMPSIDALRQLISLAEQGSVSAAARRLGLTQPTLSRRLQPFRLRDSNAEAILVRKGRGLELTPKGRRFLPAVRELVRQYEQLRGFIEGGRSAPQIVRVGVGSFAAQFYLPRALAALRDRQFDCEVATELARGKQRILGTLDGRFDLAVVSHDAAAIQSIARAAPLSGPLLVEALASQRFCVIANVRDQRAARLREQPPERACTLASLAELQFVGLDQDSGIRIRLEAEFRKLGIDLRFKLSSAAGGWGAAKEYVRNGFGAAIVPTSVISPQDAADFTIRRLPDRFSATDQLIRRPGRSTAAQEEVIRALRAAARKHLREVQERWERMA